MHPCRTLFVGPLSVGRDFVMGKRGPQKIAIDWDLISRLSALQCTQEEIAFACKLSVDSLYNRAPKEIKEKLSDYIKKSSMGGKISLRRWQFKAAEAGSETMLIWLGKQYLSQTNNGIRNPESVEGASAEKTEVQNLVNWLGELDKI